MAITEPKPAAPRQAFHVIANMDEPLDDIAAAVSALMLLATSEYLAWSTRRWAP